MGRKRQRTRVSGEGTIYRRPDGRWNAAIWIPTIDGKRRVSTTKKTKLEADRWLTQRKAERDGGLISDTRAASLTVGEFLIEWLANSVGPSVDPKTYEGYEVVVNAHLIPAFGDMKLKHLSARDVQIMMAQKARGEGFPGKSVRTRRGILQTLRRALEQAVRWRLVPYNVARDVDSPTERAEEHEELAVFTEAQLQTLFRVAQETGDRFRNLYVVAARTGLREGELLGLKWEDLMLEAKPAILSLRRSLAHKPGGARGPGGYHFTPLKRKNQRRRLALYHEAADALRRQRDLQAEEIEAAGGRWRGAELGAKLGLVFPNTLGGPMDASNMYERHYKPLLVAAGLPDLTFHDLRHTFVSIALFEWKLDLKAVQMMVGHASIKLTLDVYSHLLPDSQEGAMKRLNEAHRSGP